ncbi:hypothetical protein [Rubinisphaera italica]|uniref:DUF115 domain-containing protein n=1 Tax=Rubinisphaera italica TaxID=2527969 RepID=A0A5C5XJ40_9PLAN|nr:hypothetical protein [Rubinisphaera italica]TWT63206.1 hypothetical protein Pan54_39590 [Rubinisphaera italica]
MQGIEGTFFRGTTDRQRKDANLKGNFAAPHGSACWLVGGGPSLTQELADVIERTPVPVMAVNLAGSGMLRPTFWTAYDPTSRFLRSVYLDAGITKFVNFRRSSDLVPESTYKVCECPNLYFFEGERERGFDDFLDWAHNRIVDWNDSFVQSIDILYQLGFRRIYLAGCEMHIKVSAEMCSYATKRGVSFGENVSLSEFVSTCEKQGISCKELAQLESAQVYHFDQEKSLAAAVATDAHYFRVSQYLRLSRLSMSRAGLQLVSVTPGSRLNDYFPYQNVEEVFAEVCERVGNPSEEVTAGLYSITGPRLPRLDWKMRDFQPLHWPEERRDCHRARCEKKREQEEGQIQDEADLEIRDHDNDRRYREKLCALQAAKIEIHEEG